MRGEVVDEFEPDASANELGVYRLVGGQVSCIPPADVPSFESEIKRIWSELNPRFVPLWVTNKWRSPNEGIVTTKHFAIGAYVTRGDFDRPAIKGLLIPTTPVYGRIPKNPIVLYDILDGLTNDERNQGMLPRWESITEQSLAFARYMAWVNRHMSPIEQEKMRDKAQALAEKMARRKVHEEAKYRHRHHDFDLAKAWGCASRIYVPNSFGAAA